MTSKPLPAAGRQPSHDRARVSNLLAALLFWVLSVVLFPVWIGCTFTQSTSQGWTLQTGFLRGQPLAPLWSPPHVIAPDVTAVVRWPFQSLDELSYQPYRPGWNPNVRVADVLEPYWTANVIRLSFGFLVLGAFLRAWTWWTGQTEPDGATTMAWSVSVFLAIGWCCVFGMNLFMLFSVVADTTLVRTLGAAWLAGQAYGGWRIFKYHKSGTAMPAASATGNGAVDDASLANSQPSWLAAHPVLWFALGLVVAGGLAMGLWMIGAYGGDRLFRFTIYQCPEYGLNGVPGDVGIGLAIAMAGWIVGAVCYWLRLARGLSAGLVAGAAALTMVVATRLLTTPGVR